MAPRFCIADVSGEAGELTWAHCYLCQFRGACIICVPSLSFGQTSSSVGGCLCLWVVVGHCLCFLTGHSGGRWCVVDVIGNHVVVVIGGIVELLHWWLL